MSGQSAAGVPVSTRKPPAATSAVSASKQTVMIPPEGPHIIRALGVYSAEESGSLQRGQECREVGLFMGGAVEAQRHLVVRDDRRDVGGDAVVEVRRARGQPADVRC